MPLRLRAPAFSLVKGGLHEQLLAGLPFQLTRAQRRVGGEIAADLAKAFDTYCAPAAR